MTALRFQTGERHQTSLASFWGGTSGVSESPGYQTITINQLKQEQATGKIYPQITVLARSSLHCNWGYLESWAAAVGRSGDQVQQKNEKPFPVIV